MIEVVFQSSACGSLKAAQNFGSGPYQDQETAFFLVTKDGHPPTPEEIRSAEQQFQERQRLTWEQALPLGGTSRDVFLFDLALSFGDIGENSPGPLRQKALERLSSFWRDSQRDAQRRIQEAVSGLEKAAERIRSGEPVRIWYSSQPDELCGLCWFLDQIYPLSASLSQCRLVRLPEWGTNAFGNILPVSSWGEVAAEDWHRYLSFQVPLPSAALFYYADLWQQMKRENAPLRAQVNGSLISVPETFYDPLILANLAEEEAVFSESRFISRLLSGCRLGIGEALTALRLEAFLASGLLSAETDPAPDPPYLYDRLLRKNRAL